MWRMLRPRIIKRSLIFWWRTPSRKRFIKCESKKQAVQPTKLREFIRLIQSSVTENGRKPRRIKTWKNKRNHLDIKRRTCQIFRARSSKMLVRVHLVKVSTRKSIHTTRTRPSIWDRTGLSSQLRSGMFQVALLRALYILACSACNYLVEQWLRPWNRTLDLRIKRRTRRICRVWLNMPWTRRTHRDLQITSRKWEVVH